MKTVFWSILLLNLLVLKDCTTKDCCGPTPTLNWAGKWILVNPKTDFTFTLIVEPKTGNTNPETFALSGVSSVNQYGAEATGKADGNVTIGPIITTKRGGSAEAMNAETMFYNSLQKVTRAEFIGGNLQLRSSDPNWSLLVFNKQ